MADNGKMSFELWMKDNVSDELRKIYEQFRRVDTKAEETMARLKKFSESMDAESWAGEKKAWQNFDKLTNAIRSAESQYASLRRKMSDSPAGMNTGVLLGSMSKLRANLRELETVTRDKNLLGDKDAIDQIVAKSRSLVSAIRDSAKAYDSEAASVRRSTRDKERNARLNESAQIRENAAALDSVSKALDRVTQAGRRQNKMWSELQGMTAAYFSLQGLAQFSKELITIGGEFEVQRIALQNILGDLSRAGEIYNQIKDLAVVSPFSFRQLATYTKQTAAFGIPSNELFDVTKRLADMSAGLGVDMNRLILAFGQVRSAAVLRGQELRQFTEAGIPLVAELAKKFTELNGRAVSTAEVFDLISKRAVPFEMVRDILWEMTDEGGRFADMQLKLSDTLAGKWSNLQDAWEIAMSNVADSSNLFGKTLKGIITLVTELINHASTLAPLFFSIGAGKILGSAANAYKNKAMTAQVADAKRLAMLELERARVNGTITQKQYAQRLNIVNQEKNYYNLLAIEGKLNALQLRRAINAKKIDAATVEQLMHMKLITAEEYKQYQSATKLSVGWRGVGAAIKGMMGPIGWATLAFEAILTGFFYWKQSSDETAEAVKSHMDSTKEKAEELKGVLDSLSKTSPANMSDYVSGIDSIVETMKTSLPANISNEIFGAANKITDVAKKYEFLKESLEDVRHAYEMAGEGSASFERLLSETDGWFTEKMGTNMEDFSDASGKLDKSLTDLAAGGGEELKRKLLEIAETLPALKAAFDDGSDGGRSIKDALNEYFMGLKDWELSPWTNAKGSSIRSIYERLDEEDARAFSAAVGRAKVRAEKYHDLQWQIEKVQEYVIKQMAASYGITAEQMEQEISADTERNGHKMGLEARAMFRKVMDSIGIYGKELEDYLRTHPIKLGFVYNVSEQVEIQNSISEFTKLALAKLGFNAYKGARINFGLDKNLKEADEWLVNDLNRSGGSNVNLADIWADRIKKAREDRRKAERIGAAGAEEARKAAEEEKKVSAAYRRYFGVDFVDDREQKKSGAASRKADSARRKQEEEERKREQKFLQSIKERLSQYKKFRKELEEEAKLLGEENAFKDLKSGEDFKELFAYFSGIGLTDEQIRDYRQSVRQIISPISGGNMTSDERRNIVIGAGNDVATHETQERRREIENCNASLRAQLGIIKEQYETYKKLLGLMPKTDAAQVAFGSAIGSQSYKDYLIRRMADELEYSRYSNYSAQDVLSMDKNTFNERFGEKSGTFSELYNAYKEEENRLQKESLDLILETIKGHRTLKQQLDDEERAYERQLEIIRSNANISDSAREEAEKGAEYAHNQKKSKLELDLFKEQSEWVAIFDDLDAVSSRTIDDMVDKIVAFSRATGLGVEEVKQLRDALSKLRAEQGERDPLSAIRGGYDAAGFFRSVLSNPFRMTDDGKYRITTSDKNYGLGPGTYSRVEIETALANAEQQMYKGVQGLEKGFKALRGVLDPVIEMFDALGMGNNPISDLLGMGSDALGAASGMMGNFDVLGKMSGGIFGDDSPITKALGKAGPWGAVAGAGLSLITSIAALHDKALQREIEASQQRQKEAESIQKNLEGTLGRVLGGVYTMVSPASLLARLEKNLFSTYDFSRWGGGTGRVKKKGVSDTTVAAYDEAKKSGSYYDAAFAAQSAQLDQLRLQYADARKMKKKDAGQIAEYESQIYEAEEALKNFATDMAKALYDIDVKSWAQDLTDAVVDAWASGEDAVKSFHDKAKELIKDLTKNILSQKVMETALAPIEKAVEEEMTSKKGRLDETSVRRIYGLLYGADGAVQKITDSLDALRAGGIDLSDAVSSGSMSGDIKSIQESTADLLASYINAIRADVFAQRTDVSEIRMLVYGMSERQNVIAEAQTSQLSQIAANTYRTADAAERIEAAILRAQRDKNFGFYLR